MTRMPPALAVPPASAVRRRAAPALLVLAHGQAMAAPLAAAAQPGWWALAGAGIGALATVAALALRRRHPPPKPGGQAAPQLDRLLETLPCAAFAKDADGCFIAVNQAYVALLGCRRSDVLGHTLAETRHLHGADADALQQAEAELRLLGTGVVREIEQTATGPGRAVPRVWSLRLQPLAGTGEPPGGLVGTLSDATGPREARHASEAAARTTDTFLSMMSHEIRTPIAGALGIIELLAQTPLDQEQVQLLGMLEDSVDTLLHILGDILDFSRIESGGLVLGPVPCNLRTLVDGLAALFAAQATDKGLRLYASIDWRLADEYRCDAGRVRQILANLLGHAIESTASGSVELRVEMAATADNGQRLRFSVSDTGSGMPDDPIAPTMPPLPQLGEPQRSARGAGMGLVLCRQLAQLMDGTLTLSNRPGEGTVACFEVVLPVLRALAPQPDMAGRVALLCTADARLGHGLANALSALGFNLIEAAPGDLSDIGADDAHLFVADAPLLAAGRLPHGVRLVRIVGHDEAGTPASIGVPLQGTPLLWRATVKACHAALDLAPPESPAEAEVPLAAPGARILVAEDHPINRAVISRQLQRLGYPHVLVENGEQALQALAVDHFDLLITDCHMPVLDGYALTYRIRAAEHGSDAHLPIIALSASVLPGQVRYCTDAGMDGFLAKPVQMHELELQLAAHLRQAETQARPAPPVPSEASPAVDAASGYHQLALLMEAFGSLRQVREVLRRLLETSRHDMEVLDDALREGDVAGQRELLHRIGGSLRLLCESGATDAVAPGSSNRQRRDLLARRLDSLEELLATLDPQDATVDGG